jgi:hypothetical protein
MLIYTSIWLAITIAVGIFGFLLGKLPVVNVSPLPWVMHRGYLPLNLPAGVDGPQYWPKTSEPSD